MTCDLWYDVSVNSAPWLTKAAHGCDGVAQLDGVYSIYSVSLKPI